MNSASPVGLIFAKAPEYSPNGVFYVEGAVLVKKPFEKKTVSLYYTYENDLWLSIQAKWIAEKNASLEIWKFKTPETLQFHSCAFAIQLLSNGTEYWDNHCGANYHLKWYSPTKILNHCAVFLDKFCQDSGNLYGNIILKNLAYEKRVLVRYTYNMWRTWEESSCVFSNTIPGNNENWTFLIPLKKDTNVRFKVIYNVNNQTYMDDNFGQDYCL